MTELSIADWVWLIGAAGIVILHISLVWRLFSHPKNDGDE
jgi:hypothetical protein